MTDRDPAGGTRLDGAARWKWNSLVWSVVLIAVVVVGWTLRVVAPIAVPVVFSVFLALLVAPVDRWVTQRAPKRAAWIGHAVAMGIILVGLLLFMGLFWIAAQQVMDRFPLQGAGQGPGSLLPAFGEGWIGAEAPDVAEQDQQERFENRHGLMWEALRALADRLTQWASSHATEMMAAAGTTIMAAVLVFFLTLIMLVEAPRWQNKVENLLDRSARRDERESVGIITRHLRRYLWIRTVMGVLTALLYVAWLWLFGIDLLTVWGLLAFLLNYVPTLGSLIAGVLPIAYAFVQKDFGTAAAVGVGILVIEQVMGNYVDPRMQGRQLSISSLVVLIALLFWGWLWGVAGAILAVPIMISILVVCAHVAPLRPIALLLSDETDAAGLDRVMSEE